MVVKYLLLVVLIPLSLAAECDSWQSDWILCEDWETGQIDTNIWNDRDISNSAIVSTEKYQDNYALEMTHPSSESGGYLNSIWYHTGYNGFINHGFEHLYARWYFKAANDFESTTKIGGFSIKKSDMSSYWDGHTGAGIRPDGITNGGGFRVVSSGASTGNIGEAEFYAYHTEQMLDRWSNGGTLFCKYYGDHTAAPPSYIDTPGDIDGTSNYYCNWDRGTEYASAMGDKAYNEYTGDRVLEKDTWYCIEAELKINTPGLNDAEMRFWIDDELRGDWIGAKFRETSDMAIHLFQITASSGSNHGTQHSYYDNVVVSTSRIGCFGSAPINECDPADVLCVDDTTGATQEYSDIQSALDVAGAGDTVLIHPGLYSPTSRLEVRASGTAGNPLTIRGLNMPVIDGSSGSSDILNVEFFDNIIIEGLEVQNAGRAGIRLTHSDNSIVRNNYAHDNYRWGIFTSFCDDILIENNECTNSADEHGIYFSNSGDRPIIRGNIIRGNNANGLHMNGDINSGSGTYHNVDGVISDALVENNIIYNNGLNGGSAINCDGVRDSIIRNNLIYDQHSSGISLYQIDGGQRSENNVVYHNTIVIADDGRWSINLKDGSCANTIRNNILLTEHSWKGSIAADCITGLDSDYNIMTINAYAVTPDDDITNYNLAEWQSQGFDAHSVTAEINDVFENFGTDFRPQDGSTAVDAGENIGITNDIAGNIRPHGNGYDIGAYESGYAGIPQCGPVDSDTSGDVSTSELLAYINSWKSGSISITELMTAIGEWKNGC